MEILENKTVKEKAYLEELENGLKVIIVPKENTNKKMELIGTFSADKCDFERAAELMREKKIDLSKLVEAKYKLDDVEQAFEAAIVPGAYRVSVVFD